MQNNEAARKVLAIDSNHDAATRIVHDYRNQHVYPYLEDRGFQIVHCQGESASRADVAPMARQDNIVYITGVGHGSYAVYLGHFNLPIFQVEAYHPEEVSGKIAHFLSCETARDLGPDFVSHGCRAYFGYKEIFTFPLKPHLADIFLECDSEIDLAFADGLTAEAVYDRVSTLYERRISELDDMDEIEAASMLEENFEHLRAPSIDSRWGDSQVQIS